MKKIKTSKLSRTLALASLSAKSGSKLAAGWIKNRISDQHHNENLLAPQAELLTQEIGKLKGPLMKIGQMISTMGKGIVPEEFIVAMRKLQNESEPLAWESIAATVRQELAPEILAELDIEQKPYAAASLGQVHRATIKSTGERICLKVQYPGVDKAIATDLAALRKILLGAGFVTKQAGFDEVLTEVREMLEMEVDYVKERETTRQYTELLKNDPRIVIPKVFDRYSTGRILATQYLPGAKIESDEVQSLSQDRRNQLALAMVDHYLKEFFVFKHVQTDPHFGNYAIAIDPEGKQDRLIMYDFGALRRIPDEFHRRYVELLNGAYTRDFERTLQANIDLQILRHDDSDFIKNLQVFLCFLVLEGFMSADDERVKRDFFDADGCYDWGETDLFLRVTSEATKFAKKGFFRPPPREFLFINRKTVGVFNYLKKIGAKINCRDEIIPYVDDSK